MKKRLPKGPVRRVQVFRHNTQHGFIANGGSVVQCESFRERIAILGLEHDKEIRRYMNRPLFNSDDLEKGE